MRPAPDRHPRPAPAVGGLAAGLALAALVLGCHGKDQGPPPPPPPAQVTVVTLRPERVQLTRELPGRVSPFMVAEVRPQVSGIVERRLFTEGGMVQAGQPLYQLADDTYRADVSSAEAALARAQAALKVAQLEVERSRTLVRGGAISTQLHEGNVGNWRLAQADVRAAKAALDSRRVILGYARITAPITGRIGKSAVTEGALVTANQPTALASIQQLDPSYVDVTQSSSELLALRQAVAAGHLEADQETPVTIVLEDGTRYPHPGMLKFAEVTVDPSTGSFLLRIQVQNPEALLLPGMYVRAVIGAGVREEGILVPQQAVTRDPKGKATAMVVEGDGKVAVRELSTTQTVGNRWLVERGLGAGDRVIVAGLQKARPGAVVQATEARPAGERPATGGSGAPGGPDAGDSGSPPPPATSPAK